MNSTKGILPKSTILEIINGMMLFKFSGKSWLWKWRPIPSLYWTTLWRLYPKDGLKLKAAKSAFSIALMRSSSWNTRIDFYNYFYGVTNHQRMSHHVRDTIYMFITFERYRKSISEDKRRVTNNLATSPRFKDD